mgnify:CR=1 FL=1
MNSSQLPDYTAESSAGHFGLCHVSPKARLVRTWFFVWFGFLAASLLSAQETKPSDNPHPSQDEVVVLKEFSVSASDNAGDYIAAEATSGTRTGSPIIDVPFNVQVLTSDLIEDFQLMNEYNEFPTVPNYSSGDGDDEKLNTNDGGTTRLRGYTPLSLRDGFSRAGPSNIANTKRVEVIMGPQSALYGQASPGGILNYISKRPRRQFWNRLTLAAGNYGYQRAELEFNGPAIPDKLFYMFNASYNFRQGASDFAQIRNKSYLFGVTYFLTPDTSLSVNLEQQFATSLQAAGAPKLVVGSTPSSSNPGASGGIDVGPYTTLGAFNRLGPYQDKYSRFDNISALLEHRFNSIFSARLNMLYYHRDWDDKTWTSGLQLDESTMRMRARQPTKRLQTIEDSAIQAELLAQFQTGALSHKLLFSADYTRDVYDNRQWYLPTSGANGIGNVISLDTRYLDPFDPTWETLDYNLVTRIGTDMKRVYQHEGVGASLRTYALGQKLVTSLSTRYSYTDADIINRLTPAQSGKSDEDGLIYSLGANYKLNGDAAVLYANTSTSYEPSVTYDKGLGRPIAAETGKGVEAGLKGSFLDHTFNYTVSLYQITKQNIREVNPDYDDTVPGSPQYLTAGEVRVRGGEVVATMVPTKSLTVIATFGYTDAEVTHDDPANEPTTVGQRPLYVPAYTASLLASYAFSGGALDGLRVRLNTTYTGDRVSQYDDTRSTNPGKREYITPSLTLVSAGVSYDIKQRGRIRHTLSLDIQNLLDKEYFTPGNFTLGRGRSYSATYRLNF